MPIVLAFVRVVKLVEKYQENPWKNKGEKEPSSMTSWQALNKWIQMGAPLNPTISLPGNQIQYSDTTPTLNTASCHDSSVTVAVVQQAIPDLITQRFRFA